ncbi:hypothetical protein [Devosia sp.]|uniref:phage late control D family protein n=1 Tax=Devosia sp. TaxID=1871048 RepID=UPI00326392CB
MIESAFKVVVAGQDVTSRWQPTLLSVSVSRHARQEADEAQMTLADPDGSTLMPATGAVVVIELGHTGNGMGQVFEGFVDTVRSQGEKSSGHTLTIAASSVDNKSKVKAPGLRTAHDKTFGDVAQDWGQKAGLSVTVAGDVGDLHRPFWIMQHESFMSWGQRMARELGASFKIIGNRGFFAPLNAGISATGQQLSPVYGAYGSNLLKWDISPVRGRPQFSAVRGRHYDINSAKWREVEQLVEGANIDVDFRSLLGSANQANAEQRSNAASRHVQRDRGDGSATIIGDYAAEPEAQFILSGARPGIDGSYAIDSVTHSLGKGSGFTTALDLSLPAAGAGRDDR